MSDIAPWNKPGRFLVVTEVAKRIAPALKLVILAEAITTDAPTAAADHGVSPHVVWKWAEEFGGLLALRTVYEARRSAASSDAALQLSHELRRRLPKLSDSTFAELAVSLLTEPIKGGGGATIINAPQAAAAAQVQTLDGDRITAIVKTLREAGALELPPGGNGALPET